MAGTLCQMFTEANVLEKINIEQGYQLAENFRILGGFMTRDSYLELANKAGALPVGVTRTVYIQTRIYNLLQQTDIQILTDKGYTVSSYALP
jgi:N-formylglutamate amidohydrolase